MGPINNRVKDIKNLVRNDTFFQRGVFMNVSFFFFFKLCLFCSLNHIFSMEHNVLQAISLNQGYQTYLVHLDKAIFRLLADNIFSRSFEENIKMFHEHLSHIENLKKIVTEDTYDNILESSLTTFREKLILQGCTQDEKKLRNISWLETETHTTLLHDIFVTKIMKLNLFSTSADDKIHDQEIKNELKDEIKDLNIIQKIDVISAFSEDVSFKHTYIAYKYLKNYPITKRALTTYVFEKCKKYIKQKLPQLAFVVISILFWYLWPKLEQKYSKDILYLYEAIGIILLNDYVRKK